MIRLDLPVNVIPHHCIHVNVVPGRRAWTSRGEQLQMRKTFRAEVAYCVPRRHRQRLASPLAVRVQFWRRCTRPADGDNLQKELLDALVEAGVIADDCYVQTCTWTIMAQGPRVKPRVVVEIEELTGEWKEPA